MQGGGLSLKAGHDFLLEGGVFTADVIETWLEYKRSNEADEVRLRPHLYELFLYQDACPGSLISPRSPASIGCLKKIDTTFTNCYIPLSRPRQPVGFS